MCIFLRDFGYRVGEKDSDSILNKRFPRILKGELRLSHLLGEYGFPEF